MKKGFTLIEILIAITILTLILFTTSAVYGVAAKNYLLEGAKSVMQKNANFTADQISKQIKEASSAPDTIGGGAFSRDTNPDDVLILGIPAKDDQNNFLYNGGNLLSDYYVYYLSGNNLHRRIYAEPTGIKSGLDGTDTTLISGVGLFECTNTNTTEFFKISCDLELSRTLSGREIKVSSETISNLRNE